MLKELWSEPGVPVLVLSCVPAYNAPRIPCIRIVEELQLAALNRPWQVREFTRFAEVNLHNRSPHRKITCAVCVGVLADE